MAWSDKQAEDVRRRSSNIEAAKEVVVYGGEGGAEEEKEEEDENTTTRTTRRMSTWSTGRRLLNCRPAVLTGPTASCYEACDGNDDHPYCGVGVQTLWCRKILMAPPTRVKPRV